MDAVSSRAGAQLGGRHERRDEDRPTLSRALLAGRVLATPGVVWLATAPIPGHHPAAWRIGRLSAHECGWRLLHPPHGGRGDGQRRVPARRQSAVRYAPAPRLAMPGVPCRYGAVAVGVHRAARTGRVGDGDGRVGAMTWPDAAYASAALLAARGVLWAAPRAVVDIYAVHHYVARYAVPLPRGEDWSQRWGRSAWRATMGRRTRQRTSARRWAFPQGKRPAPGYDTRGGRDGERECNRLHMAGARPRRALGRRYGRANGLRAVDQL